MPAIASLSLNLTANTKDFSRGLDRASSEAAKFGKSVSGSANVASRSMGDFVRGSTGGLANFAKSAVQGAASIGIYSAAMSAMGAASGVITGAVNGAAKLGDVMSKTGVIFGASAGEIFAESEKMAKQFGTVKTEYIDAATSFGSVFKGLGKSQSDAAKLGNSLTKLGMDMASFEGVANSEAFSAISSALRGEMDPIERFRVFLSADKIAAEALAMGLAKTKGAIDETSKKMATMSLITKQTKDAQGDLARTSGETSNQQKSLQGTLQNLSDDFGKTFLPAVNAGIGALKNFADAGAKAFLGQKASITDFVALLSTELTAAGVLVQNWEISLEIAELQVGAFAHNIGESFGTLAKNVGESFNWMGRLVKERALDIAGAAQDIGAAIKAVPAWINGKAFVPDLQPIKPPAPNPLNFQKANRVDVGPGVKALQQKMENNGAGKPIQNAADVKEQQGPGAPPGGAAANPTNKVEPPKSGSGATVAVAPELKAIADRLRSSLETGAQKLEKQVGELRQAQNAGLITPIEFQKGKARAEAEAADKGKPQLAGAATMGSSAAYSSIVSAMTARGPNEALTLQRALLGQAVKQTAYQAMQARRQEESNRKMSAGTFEFNI